MADLAAWWEQWRTEDYSLAGLAKKPRQGWSVAADGFLVETDGGIRYAARLLHRQPHCQQQNHMPRDRADAAQNHPCPDHLAVAEQAAGLAHAAADRLQQQFDQARDRGGEEEGHAKVWPNHAEQMGPPD